MDNYMDPFMVITCENPIHCASLIRPIRPIRVQKNKASRQPLNH